VGGKTNGNMKAVLPRMLTRQHIPRGKTGNTNAQDRKGREWDQEQRIQ
jgi:hypothetical protein